MPLGRNPFNENVNRLMEKIFSGKDAGIKPKEGISDRYDSGTGAGILHNTKIEKRKVKRKKNAKKDSPAAQEAGILLNGREEKIPKKSEKLPVASLNIGRGKERRRNGEETSLKSIRSVTEKMRETTRQLQQITFEIWADNVRGKRAGGENQFSTNLYEEEKIPPRRNNAQEDKPGGWKQESISAGKYQSADFVKQSMQKAGSWSGGYTKQPQYRMEEVMDDSVPDRIRECRALPHSPEGYRMTKEELFFRQALMMEDYTDNCLYPGDFTWYFPTYQAMNIAQLRGYFTWRAGVRQGDIAPAPLSFAFVYVYELLHQVGAKTPQEGFLLLKTFWENYREHDIQLDRYIKNRLCDYVVYYNLDRELLSDIGNLEFDNAMFVFLHPEEYGDEEYFKAICALSKYNMEGSKFYKEKPDDVRSVTCGVFRALAVHYAKHGKKTLSEKYFGTLTTCAYQMFVSAVFYDQKKYVEYEYEVNPIHRYRCVNGHWSCEKYFGNYTKNKDMGLILHAVDARMRERYDYKFPLKLEGMTKLVINCIDKEIDRLSAKREKDAAPVVEIDLSKLDGIRRASELTRDKLIVDDAEKDVFSISCEQSVGGNALLQKDCESKENLQESVTAKFGQLEFVWDGNADKEESVTENNSGQPFGEIPAVQEDSTLEEWERIFLQSLLDGTPYKDFLRARRLMLSVVVDSINEKLYDRFGDTVIVFNGDIPELLEDYAGEVAGLLGGV